LDLSIIEFTTNKAHLSIVAFTTNETVNVENAVKRKKGQGTKIKHMTQIQGRETRVGEEVLE
jgi:hypothetical protein